VIRAHWRNQTGPRLSASRNVCVGGRPGRGDQHTRGLRLWQTESAWPAFQDLPLVVDDDEARRVHHTADLFFLSKSRLTAHEGLDCNEVGGYDRVVNNPAWRMATGSQVRALQGHWCDFCCS
jgi:hypothetical protein